MPALLLIAVGIYLLAVAYHGNTTPFISAAWSDTQKMGLWVIAWIVLLVAGRYSRVGKYMLILAILGYILKSSGPLQSNLAQIWGQLKSASNNGPLSNAAILPSSTFNGGA